LTPLDIHNRARTMHGADKAGSQSEGRVRSVAEIKNQLRQLGVDEAAINSRPGKHALEVMLDVELKRAAQHCQVSVLADSFTPSIALAPSIALPTARSVCCILTSITSCLCFLARPVNSMKYDNGWCVLVSAHACVFYGLCVFVCVFVCVHVRACGCMSMCVHVCILHASNWHVRLRRCATRGTGGVES
jgi:hypothetical protein